MSCADILDAAGFIAGAPGAAGGAAGGLAGGTAQLVIRRINSAGTMPDTRRRLRARRVRKNVASVSRRFIRSTHPDLILPDHSIAATTRR
jgi:hypothetical protein